MPSEFVYLPFSILGILLVVYFALTIEPLVLKTVALEFGGAQTTYFALYITPVFIVILIWLVISLVVWKDARKRKKTPFAWFLVVLFTGIIGALIYYLRREEVLI